MSEINYSEVLPFFVYGTLLPGHANFHLFGDESQISHCEASLSYAAMFAKATYPVMRKSELETDQVVGVVVTMTTDRFHEKLRFLDQLEDFDVEHADEGEYRREQVEVKLKDNETVVAWTYFGRNVDFEKLKKIESGSWDAYVKELSLIHI